MAHPEGHAAETAAPAGPADLSPAACAARLAELFPALFGAGRMLPIKLRIQADIQQRAPGVFSKKSLSIFLHRHTTSTAYIRALLQATHRFDLDGAPAGDIAEEHRAAATLEAERRRAIVDARRAAEREAARQAANAARRAQAEQLAAGTAGPGAALPDATAQRPPRPPRPPRREREHEPRQQRPAPAQADAPSMQAAPAPLDRPASDAPPAAPAPPVTRYGAEELAARRERSALLHSWETSTLTRANFCVLKRITESALEAQLAVARQEREQDPPRPERRPDRPDMRPKPRRDARHNPGADPARPGRSGPRGGPGAR